ncbi:MAG: BrnT family toxin [Ruminococcus sp.]|nr:BrnT family toxin [Ruminococcus sp.]
MRNQFEWDNNKEQANIAKRHIDFKTAMPVFNDYYRIEKYDKPHSQYED